MAPNKKKPDDTSDEYRKTKRSKPRNHEESTKNDDQKDEKHDTKRETSKKSTCSGGCPICNCKSETHFKKGLDNMADDQSEATTRAESVVTVANLQFPNGKKGARTFIREALDYALDSGYLKPQDSTVKLLSVSTERKSKDVPQTSGKRARSSSVESQIYHEDNDKSYKRKKRKVAAGSRKSHSRSRSIEPKKIKVSQSEKQCTSNQYKLSRAKEASLDRSEKKFKITSLKNQQTAESSHWDSSDEEYV